jgi:hypothetical protein
MCHDVQIPYSEDDNPAWQVSVTVFRLPEPKIAMGLNEKQRAVVEFLLLEECAAAGVVICLWNEYGPAAYCRVSVVRWISEVRRCKAEPRNEGCPGRPNQYEIDVAIPSILQENPNASLRIIPETLSISPEMVCMHMSRIGHTLKTLRWIPQALNYELRHVRLSMYLQLFPKLRTRAQ